jgi:hypothetical protein
MTDKGTPSDGWAMLKAKRGARLMRSQEDESLSLLAIEGTEGWKRGLLCPRMWTGPAYGPSPTGAERYTVTVLDGRPRGDGGPPTYGEIARAHGKTNREVWQNVFAALRLIGVMPSGVTE